MKFCENGRKSVFTCVCCCHIKNKEKKIDIYMCEKKNEGCLLSGLNSRKREQSENCFFLRRISESFDFRLGRALSQTVHLFCFWLKTSVGVEFNVCVAVFKQLFQRRFNLKRMRGDRQALRAPLTRKLRHRQLLPCSRESWQR